MQQVTSIEDLRLYGQGTIVELPPFAEGQPFVAIVRRPSMMVLMKSGQIPNTLLASANKMFAGASPAEAVDETTVKDMADVLEIVAEASLVQPAYSQIKESGVQLSDEQLIFLYNYSQEGVKYLNSFRKQRAGT